MGTAGNVKTYGNGLVATAPLDSTLPDDTVTALDMAFTDLGFISEDGLGEVLNTTTSDYKVWQNAAVVATSVTDASVEISFAMAEDSEIVKSVFYGADATAGIRDIDPAVRYRGAFVLHLIDTAGGEKRMVVADGEVISREQLTYANAGPSTFGITIKAYPHDDLNGAPYREITEDANA